MYCLLETVKQLLFILLQKRDLRWDSRSCSAYLVGMRPELINLFYSNQPKNAILSPGLRSPRGQSPPRVPIPGHQIAAWRYGKKPRTGLASPALRHGTHLPVPPGRLRDYPDG